MCPACAVDRAYEQRSSRVHVQFSLDVRAGGGLADRACWHEHQLRPVTAELPAVAGGAATEDAGAGSRPVSHDAVALAAVDILTANGGLAGDGGLADDAILALTLDAGAGTVTSQDTDCGTLPISHDAVAIGASVLGRRSWSGRS